jgi:hypothetical protein
VALTGLASTIIPISSKASVLVAEKPFFGRIAVDYLFQLSLEERVLCDPDTPCDVVKAFVYAGGHTSDAHLLDVILIVHTVQI